MVNHASGRRIRLFIQPDDGPITPIEIDAEQMRAQRTLDGDGGEAAIIRQIITSGNFPGLKLDSPATRVGLSAVLARTGTLYNISPDVQGFVVHIPGSIVGPPGASAAMPANIQTIIDGLKKQLADNATAFQQERNAFQAAIRQAQTAASAAGASGQVVSQLQQRLGILAAENTRLNGELATAQSQLTVEQAAHAQMQQALQAKIDELTADQLRQQNDRQQAAGGADAAKKMVTQLQAANSQLQAANTTAERDNRTLQQNNDTLRQKIKALQAQLEALTLGAAGAATPHAGNQPSADFML